MSYIGILSNGSFDAFSRLRVSNPETIFDSKLIDDGQTLFWDDAQTAGAGTASAHQTNQASMLMSVANVTAGTRTRQTRRRFAYQPGKSQLLFLTGVLGTGVAGITRRIGQFDDNNGTFFELAGVTLSVIRRTSTSGAPIDTPVVQASWNLDPLDGTGPSGVTLDTTKTQIFVIDYEWLGVGTIRYGFVIDGEIIYVHRSAHANVLALPWSSNPNVPIRHQIINDGAGPAATLRVICSTVITEGGQDETGIARSVDRGITGVVMNDNSSLFPLVSIRLQATKNWVSILLESVDIAVITASNFRWRLLLNPTITGVALAFTPIVGSGIEADIVTANTSTVSGGTILASGYATSAGGSSARQVLGDFRLGADIAGISDILVLAVGKFAGANETALGSISWRETQ